MKLENISNSELKSKIKAAKCRTHWTRVRVYVYWGQENAKRGASSLHISSKECRGQDSSELAAYIAKGTRVGVFCEPLKVL